MPSFELLATFMVASTVLSLSPGPSNLYIVARSIGQGPRAGFTAASGMAVGSIIYAVATAFGLAALFTYSPFAHTCLKLAGAGYLIFLALRYLHSKAASDGTQPEPMYVPLTAIFQQSIIVELSNPKTALFFIAFLPQFVDPSATSVITQLIFLGCLYALIALASDLFVATLSGQIGKILNTNQSFQKWQDRISGALLLSLGVYLLIGELWL
jgi:threonine/homoserine/homoserine lactone efflux protein